MHYVCLHRHACISNIELRFSAYMYVCMYVCRQAGRQVGRYVCMYVCMRVCVYVFICIHILYIHHVYIYICIYVYTYICIYVYMYICIRFSENHEELAGSLVQRTPRFSDAPIGG